jgi:hypothetical protein
MTFDFKQAIYNEFENYRTKGEVSSQIIASFLENDIYAIMELQDSEMFKSAAEIFKWLQENFPPEIWGSKEKVEDYQHSKGIGV